MQNKSYTATIEVTKFPEDVFKAITAHVSKWWGGKDLTGSCLKLHDEFVILHPGAHYSKQKLVEVVPNKKVVWLVTESKLDWLEKNQHEWASTKMVFEITPKEHSTILQFTHEGLVPEMECYVMCSEGWKMVITNWLFNFIANGKAHF
jgi:uncharacterized protein YndB with AHSA1/START domain